MKIMKTMNSFPGGTLLLPMFVSALIYTFFPGLFNIGGVTEALFSGSGLNYILGATIFISGCSLNLATINKVIQRYGSLLLFRTIFATTIGILFFKVFGIDGIFGINSVAFIVALLSLNPTLFLALMGDFGDNIDKDSFGFVSLFASPVIPIVALGFISP